MYIHHSEGMTVWRPEDSFLELILSFYHVGPKESNLSLVTFWQAP